MSKKTTIIIIILLSLSLLLLTYLTFKTNLFFKQKTLQTPNPPSLQNSYLFASPLKAKADLQEKIRLTVVLLNNQGLGIKDQKVELDLDQNLQIDAIQELTDDSGIAIFDLSSPTPRKFKVNAKVGSYSLPQTLEITFYE